METKGGSLIGRWYIDMRHKNPPHAQDYDLVTLFEFLFFLFDGPRWKRLEYGDEMIEILKLQQNQSDYDVFLLVEQKDKISYRRGLGAMIKAAFKVARPSFQWIPFG